MTRENLKLFTASAILIGTIIGAGFLAIPGIVAKSGYVIGAFYLISIGILMLYLNLALGEISLRTKGHHQLTGYALKYLGVNAKRLMFFTMIFGIYSALLAYLLGTSKSLSFLFFGNISYFVYFGIGLWLVNSILISHGLSSVKKPMYWGTLAVLFLILVISLIRVPHINVDNFKTVEWKNIFLPVGVILFAYLGTSSLPEIERYLYKREKLMKRTILIGSIVPIVVYFIFTSVLVGVYGKSIDEISTLSLGGLFVVLGIITMVTSYLILSVALRDMFILDYHKSKKKAWFYTCSVPLILFLISVFAHFDSFSAILSISGTISAGLTGVLVVAMIYKAKKEGSRKPEYEVFAPKWFLILIVLLFFVGMAYEILHILSIF